MKKGILFVNLGSPKSTEVSDVRTYLREFLSDKYVIDTSWLMRKFIVECIILPRRPKKSAEAYQSIWWEEGSPLIVLSERFTEKAKEVLDAPVALAMRYGNPSIDQGITELKKQGVTDILVVPLYPHYAMSTVTTVVEKAKQVQQKNHPNIHLEFLPVWYDHPDYIEVLSDSIKKNLPEELDYLLFSYHGVPHSHIFKTDITQSHCQINDECCQKATNETGKKAQSVCYRHQCFSTTWLTAEKLGLNKDQYGIAFQSRLGNQPWLQPATDDTLEALPAQGKRKVAVVCPAFVSDCLETLEEISMEGKEEFLEAGGKEFHYIDCLNDQDAWVKLMAKWCNEWISKN
ncbi:protoporphyrin ferrochelatase [Flavobacteriaceae bacterium UJ101]|nr:protoporphyrin ferrochelatase [Flavobacteriaceae bacterium UJ101]